MEYQEPQFDSEGAKAIYKALTDANEAVVKSATKRSKAKGKDVTPTEGRSTELPDSYYHKPTEEEYHNGEAPND